MGKEKNRGRREKETFKTLSGNNNATTQENVTSAKPCCSISSLYPNRQHGKAGNDLKTAVTKTVYDTNENGHLRQLT